MRRGENQPLAEAAALRRWEMSLERLLAALVLRKHQHRLCLHPCDLIASLLWSFLVQIKSYFMDFWAGLYFVFIEGCGDNKSEVGEKSCVSLLCSICLSLYLFALFFFSSSYNIWFCDYREKSSQFFSLPQFSLCGLILFSHLSYLDKNQVFFPTYLFLCFNHLMYFLSLLIL